MILINDNSLLSILRKSALPLIAIASLIYAALTYYYEKETGIVFDVVSETNVLDINAPVQGLEVMFRGQDISERELNLRLLMLRVENNGNVNLLENSFDQDIDWGIKVSGGDIIRTRIAGTSSTYIDNNLNPRLVNEHTIVFDKIIFDVGAYFLYEILILHDKNEEPRLSTTGKISGIGEISVNRSWKERAKTETGSSNKTTVRLFTIGMCALILLLLWILRINQLASRQRTQSEIIELIRVLKEKQIIEESDE